MDNSAIETEAVQGQNLESPRDFKSAREAVVNLANHNEHAKGLVGVLDGKMTNWASDLDPRFATQRVTQDNIPAVMSWLVQSSDFADFQSVEAFIEGSIGKHIDGLTQTMIQQPDGTIVGGLSQEYRKAKDELLKTIQGFIENYKLDPTQNELTFWSRTSGSDGNFPLRQADRLRTEHNLQRVELGKFVFYLPEAQKDQIGAFGMLAEQMENVIGAKVADKKRVHVLLVPGSEFCPRGGFASPDGRRIILDINHPDKFRIFAHEYTHAYLGQAMGASKSTAAMEGAAVYFARQRFPADTRNDYGVYPWGFTDIVDLSQKGVEVGFSHTQMLERVGKNELTPAEKYEYAYRFGGFLAEYIVTKFGKEKFLEFYERTCRDNFFSSRTGRPLIQNGVRIVGEREVVEQALFSVGLNPAAIKKDFDVFIKSKTVG